MYMRILGIDPGYDRLGVAMIEKDNGSETLLYSDCFETDSKLTFHDRLRLVGAEVENVIHSYTPHQLGIENVFFNTNQKTAMHIGEVRGAILYIAGQNDLEIFEYTPPQIKAAVAGTGRGTKKDVITMLHKLIDINKKIRHDDEYDAIAVALTHSACCR